MSVCRQCGKQWPDTYLVCPGDGMQLSAISTPTVAASTGALALHTSATHDDDLAPGTEAGEYVIEQKLGQGGMGAVYGARHPVIGKRAAVKVISRELSASQEAVERFVREAQAVNQIGHPNIVDVFGFGQLADGRSFFVMEWLVGETLRARMLRPLALRDALDILDQIAMALEAAHDAGVLHRDLKPDNVFLVSQKTGRGGDSSAPNIKLLDFGLAKLHGGADPRVDHTRTGVVMGTPLYLSPEQAKGIRVDFPADIYSLGAIAYELCSGQVPFIGDSPVETMAKHISEHAVPLAQIAPHTPPALDRLVAAMLEKEPQQRPTLSELRTRLAEIRARPLAGTATAASRAPVTRTPDPVGQVVAVSKPPRRKKRALVLAVVAIGAAAGALVLVVGDLHEAKTPARAVAPSVPNVAPASVPLATASDSAPANVEAATPASMPTQAAATTRLDANPEAKSDSSAIKKRDASRPGAAKVAADKAKTGTLVVHIDDAVSGAIWIDDKLEVTAAQDWSVELLPGKHKLRAGGRSASGPLKWVTITAGQQALVTLASKPRKAQTPLMDYDEEDGR